MMASFIYFNVGLAWIQTDSTFASVIVTLLHFKNVVTFPDIFVSFILELCMVCILLPGSCNSVWETIIIVTIIWKIVH